MKIIRIAFLVIVITILGVVYVTRSISSPSNENNAGASSDINLVDAQKPDMPHVLVPFVPVTAFTNFALDDLKDVSTTYMISDKWYAYAEGLPVWDTMPGKTKTVSENMVEAMTANPVSDVYIVPLSDAIPEFRVLKVNDISYFDLEDKDSWPLNVSLPQDIAAGMITTSDNLYEMSFGGTVVLSRGVAERIRKYNDPSYPWQKITDIISRADVNIINFKGSITNDCVYDGYTLKFCGLPSYVKAMADAGVDGVSVSGNHIGDYGQIGMQQTIEALNLHAVGHTGLGKGYDDAFTPLVYTFGEGDDAFTVAMVAYNNVFGTAPCAGTATTSYGVTCLTNEKATTKEIQSIKDQYDIVVAYPNWGPEYTHYPDQSKEVTWGRLLVDGGADLVVGDQAHWVQTMEFYKDTPVFYGVGNFVFDQMWSDKTTEGLLLRTFLWNGKILSIEPVPIKIYDYAQPRVETGTSIGDTILSYLALPLSE